MGFMIKTLFLMGLLAALPLQSHAKLNVVPRRPILDQLHGKLGATGWT